MSHKCIYCYLAKPPRVIVQPKELKDAVACKPVTFTIEVTGTEPLSYHWQRNVGGASGRWQSCDVETFPGANSHTLTIPSVQKSDEGSYCCVISNIVDSQISESVQLSIGKLYHNRLCMKCYAIAFLCIQLSLPESLFIHIR